MICEECLEPSTDPVDGSRLDLCTRCERRIVQLRRGAGAALPANARGWAEGKHFEFRHQTYYCMFCSKVYDLRQSMRRHLNRDHGDVLPRKEAA